MKIIHIDLDIDENVAGDMLVEWHLGYPPVNINKMVKSILREIKEKLPVAVADKAFKKIIDIYSE